MLSGHERAVSSAAFSPDGQRVVTASADNTARLWDAASGKSLAVLSGHEDAVLGGGVQPGRAARRDRLIRQDRAAVGCRQRQEPRRAHAAMRARSCRRRSARTGSAW